MSCGVGQVALIASTYQLCSGPRASAQPGRSQNFCRVLLAMILLYAGAAAVGLLSRQRIEREARLQRSDLPRLLAMAAFGAAIGPVALAWGLQNTSGTSASLMLTLEALFTAVLAWRLYRETMDGRVWTAIALLLAGGMVLASIRLRVAGGGPQRLTPARLRGRFGWRCQGSVRPRSTGAGTAGHRTTSPPR